MKKILIGFIVTNLCLTQAFAHSMRTTQPQISMSDKTIVTSVWQTPNGPWVSQRVQQSQQNSNAPVSPDAPQPSRLEQGLNVVFGILGFVADMIDPFSPHIPIELVQERIKFDNELWEYSERLWFRYMNDADYVNSAVPKINEAVARFSQLCREKLQADCSAVDPLKVFIAAGPLDVRVYRDGQNYFEISADALMGPNYLEQMVSRIAEVGFHALPFAVGKKFREIKYGTSFFRAEAPVNSQGKHFSEWLLGKTVAIDPKPFIAEIENRERILGYLKDSEKITDPRHLRDLTVTLRPITLSYKNKEEERYQFPLCVAAHEPIVKRLVFNAPPCQEANLDALMGGGFENLKHKMNEAVEKQLSKNASWKAIGISVGIIAVAVFVNRKLAVKEGVSVSRKFLLRAGQFITITASSSAFSAYNSRTNTTLLWKLDGNNKISQDTLELLLEVYFDESWQGQMDRGNFQQELAKRLTAKGIKFEIRQGKLSVAEH